MITSPENGFRSGLGAVPIRLAPTNMPQLANIGTATTYLEVNKQQTRTKLFTKHYHTRKNFRQMFGIVQCN